MLHPPGAGVHHAQTWRVSLFGGPQRPAQGPHQQAHAKGHRVSYVLVEFIMGPSSGEVRRPPGLVG
eukprot:7000305-Prorocentrum_lima.AAC.1